MNAVGFHQPCNFGPVVDDEQNAGPARPLPHRRGASTNRRSLKAFSRNCTICTPLAAAAAIVPSSEPATPRLTPGSTARHPPAVGVPSHRAESHAPTCSCDSAAFQRTGKPSAFALAELLQTAQRFLQALPVGTRHIRERGAFAFACRGQACANIAWGIACRQEAHRPATPPARLPGRAAAV